MDKTVFWLGDDRIVYLASSYNPQRVSTHAIEQAVQGYSTVSDAFAFSYTEEGHKFYVLTFPSESVTWCYDMATQSWHEREHYAWDKVNQKMGIRHRANSYSYFNGYHVIGDYSDGILYALDRDSYVDGTSASAGTDLVTNGDFSDDDTGWTLTGGVSVGSTFLLTTDPCLKAATSAGTATQAGIFEAGTKNVDQRGSGYCAPTSQFVGAGKAGN